MPSFRLGTTDWPMTIRGKPSIETILFSILSYCVYLTHMTAEVKNTASLSFWASLLLSRKMDLTLPTPQRSTLRSGSEIIYCNYRICGSYFLINLFASFSDVALHQNNHEKAPVSFKVVPMANNPSVKEAKYRSNRRKCGNYHQLFGCQIEAYFTM